MFIFRGNSRTFRCSPMLLTGAFTIKLGLFWRFWRCNIQPKNRSRVCMVILVLFGVLPHPAQELMFIFRGSFRTFRCSCSHRVFTYRVSKHRAHTCCSHIEVFLWLCGGVFVVVFLWWCSCSGVVVFLCWCGGVFVVVLWPENSYFFFAVSTSGPRTRTCRCFARLWWCFWCFCGGVSGVFVVLCQHPARELVLVAVLQDCGGVFGVFVVVFLVFLWCCVNIRPENSYLSLFCKIVVVFLVFLWWCFWCFCGAVSTSGPRTRTCRCFARLWWCFWCFCGGVSGVFVVVVQWWQHPARELVLFGVLQDCGFGLAVFVVVFLKWSGGVFVVVVQWCQHLVFLWWWCGGVNIRPENSCFSVFCNKDVLVRGITTL